MSFNVGFATDIGLKRQKNQDAGGVFPEIGLFIVADGMGGHRGGEIASSMVVDIMPGEIRKARDAGNFNPPAAITQAIQAANRAIFERAMKEPELQGMGTTTTALLFEGDRLWIGHVGDSRCYFILPEGIWQMTRDHSFVQEKLRAGLITREQAKNDQTKNVITRSVGFASETQVEVYEVQCRPGDTYLLCSDGLSGAVEDREILGVLQKHDASGAAPSVQLKSSVDDLVSWANARGGFDNITVVIAQVPKPGQDAQPASGS